jgi:hypothetical protein
MSTNNRFDDLDGFGNEGRPPVPTVDTPLPGSTPATARKATTEPTEPVRPADDVSGLTPEQRAQWRGSAVKFPGFLEIVNEGSKGCKDTRIPGSMIETYVNETGGLGMKVNGKAYPVTDSGLATAWTNLTGLPASILGELGHKKHSFAFAEELNNIYNKARERDKSFLVRTKAQKGKQHIRAILPETYVQFDNLPLLQAVSEGWPEGLGAIGDCWVLNAARYTGDSMNVMLLPESMVTEKEDGEWAIGVRLTADELGGPIRIQPVNFRSYCWNGMVFGERNATIQNGVFNFNHAGEFDQAKFVKHVGDTIRYACGLGSVFMERFDASRDVEIADPDAFIAQLAINGRMSNKTARHLASGYDITIAEEPAVANTLFGIMNGITRAAQFLENQKARTGVEAFAGSLLASGNGSTASAIASWRIIEQQAAALEDDTVNRMLRLQVAAE